MINASVDVALQLFGKPCQTALCLLSLHRHCGPWLHDIFGSSTQRVEFKPRHCTLTASALLFTVISQMGV